MGELRAAAGEDRPVARTSTEGVRFLTTPRSRRSPIAAVPERRLFAMTTRTPAAGGSHNANGAQRGRTQHRSTQQALALRGAPAASASAARAARATPPRATTRRAIARAKQGDREALRYLYVRYADNVYSYVATILRDHHEAEDVTQQVFAKLIDELPRYEDRGAPFLSWLLRLARNAAIDQLRARRAIPVAEPIESGRRRSGERDRDASRRCAARSTTLPEDQREIIVLRHLAGLAPAEIAARLRPQRERGPRAAPPRPPRAARRARAPGRRAGHARSLRTAAAVAPESREGAGHLQCLRESGAGLRRRFRVLGAPCSGAARFARGRQRTGARGRRRARCESRVAGRPRAGDGDGVAPARRCAPAPGSPRSGSWPCSAGVGGELAAHADQDSGAAARRRRGRRGSRAGEPLRAAGGRARS